ncbi:MAG: alanine--tRNA ligase [Nanoarchaeota archaeon]|nr:alanine--tRNA ligase [Nanoarchaeota archaeon]
MDSKELKKKYIEFFKKKGHAEIKSSPLVPENDPTVLFTTAGMHPLVPFLLGQPHPSGKRLVGVQKCLRTGDIDDVGDPTHNTFFEMLGNWSLGDYWKEDAIKWCYEFLKDELKIDMNKLHVTVFAGNETVPKDEESAKIWKSLGIPEDRIHYMGMEDNWWGPPGEEGPCGPDTEMFVDTGKSKCGPNCKPGCGCGKYFEIWNAVFMEYFKTKDGKFEPLKQKNVDTGMGVERTTAILNGYKSVYETDLFKPIMEKINELKEKSDEKAERIIADHLRASTFILAEKIPPSNVERGYVLRRLIRRAIRYGRLIGMKEGFVSKIAKTVIERYKEEYPEVKQNEEFILEELDKEEKRFLKTLESGLKVFNKIAKEGNISGEKAFLLFQSYGFPLEMTVELAKERGLKVDVEGFHKEYKKHQEISRKGAEKEFKGGLADTSYESIKLHTATHLLAEALRRVLKRDIIQKGSNITPERLRFDFNFDRKLTDEEIKKVEDLVNEKIKEGLPVYRKEMTLEEAKKIGAQGVFEEKYGDKVYVYFIDDFSKEICGGPHVKNTKELGKFKIVKQKSVAAGVRRIKAILLNNSDE